jgi:hypothetical protein
MKQLIEHVVVGMNDDQLKLVHGRDHIDVARCMKEDLEYIHEMRVYLVRRFSTEKTAIELPNGGCVFWRWQIRDGVASIIPAVASGDCTPSCSRKSPR